MSAAPPKQLTLQTPIVRESTLVWLQRQDPSLPWNRWDGVVSSLDDWDRWSPVGRVVGIVLLSLGPDAEKDLERLYHAAKTVSCVFLPETILTTKSEAYWNDNFDNVLNLDALSSHYPYFGHPWDGTAEDAVCMMAVMRRYARMVDCPLVCKPREPLRYEQGVVPESFWWITQLFRAKEKPRMKELVFCLKQNCLNPLIDQIVLLNEEDMSDVWAHMKGREKIRQIVIGKRLEYIDFLRFVKGLAPSLLVALANADIYAGNTLEELWRLDMRGKLLALLRWDDPGTGMKDATLFGPRADSQDCWIVLSDSVHAMDVKKAKDDFSFSLGQPGCDNAFAGAMLKHKFLLSNPARTIKTFHVHTTNIRHYNKKDYIPAPLYINLAPTHLLYVKQEQTPPKADQCICNELVAFEVKSSSLSDTITYCTMLEKAGRFRWEPQVENHAFEPAIPVYSWKGAAVTKNGLVFDLKQIYMGKHAHMDETYNYWKQPGCEVGEFTPLSYRPSVLAVPLRDSSFVFRHKDVYVLEYLSRCARLLSLYPGFSFWVPPSFHSVLSAFQWKHAFGSELMYREEEETACWADHVAGYVPGPSVAELGREDIQALRDMYPFWESVPLSKTCVVVTDSILTEEWVHRVVEPLLEGWTVCTVSGAKTGQYQALVGASLCLISGGKETETRWSSLWALPKGAVVVEFQQELAMDGGLQHLCHMSDFHSWVLLLAKGSTTDVQDQMEVKWKKWWKKTGAALV